MVLHHRRGNCRRFVLHLRDKATASACPLSHATRSQINAKRIMEYRITSTDFAEHVYGHYQKPSTAPHEKLGGVRFGAQALPFMQTVELDWQLPNNDVVLTDDGGGNGAINISFQVRGDMFTRFAGVHHPLNMKAGSHNLVYLTERGDTHVMTANQHLSVFQLTVDTVYFSQCLQPGNVWSDAVLHKINCRRPFAASEQSPVITPRMGHLIQCLQTDKRQGPVKTLLTQSRVLELLALQLEQLSADKKETNVLNEDDLQRLHVLKAYIDVHFLDELSLTGLSRSACLNEFKLKKGFKSAFGETVFGYVRRLRMEYAAKLLHDTRQTVDEVADALGYEHAHHFTKAFKAYSGFTPTAYRLSAIAALRRKLE